MEGDASVQAARFALQVGLVLLAAKIGAEVFERWLRQPAVLGELAAGALIGPFVLGRVAIPGIGALLPATTGGLGIPEPLWAFGELAAVVLLFSAGLQTEFSGLMRHAPKAFLVAAGGVVVPFALGDLATVAAGLATDPLSPGALFVGAALTATSVAITARLLGDLRSLDTPEGLTILGAAVIDDVIGIVTLAVVVSIAGAGSLDVASIGLIGARAVLVWAGMTAVLVLTADRVAGLVLGFRSAGAPVALAIALALVAGFVAQAAGLAMIIGAFSAGIALSRSPLRAALEEQVRTVQHAIVPAFFVLTGMLVDLGALGPVAGFTLLITLLAIAGKLLGCGIPALSLGLGAGGATRVAVGMIPRGEVALIIGGIGLASGAIDAGLFTSVVAMAFATTIVAPLLIQPAFKAMPPAIPVAGAQVRGEVLLPVRLMELFDEHLMRALAARGFEQAASWAADGDIMGREFRREGTLASVLVVPLDGDMRRLEVESEVATDWTGILAAALQAAAAEAARAYGGAIGASDARAPDRLHPAP